MLLVANNVLTVLNNSNRGDAMNCIHAAEDDILDAIANELRTTMSLYVNKRVIN
jgi:hypothetical protein